MYLDIKNILNLSIVSGIGSMRLRSLIAKFKSAEDVFHAPQSKLIEVEGIDVKTAQKIKEFSDFQFGDDQFNKATQLGIDIVTFWDHNYPVNLKKIYDPPAFIFVKGNIEEADKNAIAIVGTRTPSAYGKIITEKITQQLSQKGITIVSGLARGVDTIAHWTAIKSSNRTFAVLGTGIDLIYPHENKNLSEKIVQQGALISEYPFGTGPDAVNFPKRNRIIAGLSLGTVVTEAGEKSGALITANLALEYNREVYAVPGNVTNPKSSGCNQLIKDGAKLIDSADDILDELLPQLRTENNRKNVNRRLETVSDSDKQILTHLSENPIHIDELARKLNRSAQDVLTHLLTLEFDDLVKQLPGKFFILMN